MKAFLLALALSAPAPLPRAAPAPAPRGLTGVIWETRSCRGYRLYLYRGGRYVDWDRGVPGSGAWPCEDGELIWLWPDGDGRAVPAWRDDLVPMWK